MLSYYEIEKVLETEKALKLENRLNKEQVFELLKKGDNTGYLVFNSVSERVFSLGKISSNGKLIRWENFGSSAIRLNKKEFNWLLKTIFKVEKPYFVKSVDYLEIKKIYREQEQDIFVNQSY